MSTATEPKPFDPIAYNKQANESDKAIREGKEPPIIAKTTEPEKPTAEPEKTQSEVERRPSRSERRQINQLLRELGEVKGKLSVFEQMAGAGTLQRQQPVATDPEPKREDFASDAEYNRAVGRWDTRQELKKVNSSESTNTEAADRIKEFGVKAETDKTEIEWPEPWEDVIKRAEEDGPVVEWMSKDNLFMTMRLFDSPHRAAMMYHLARYPEQFEELLAFKGDEISTDRFISRLEGRVEVMYSKRKAAQASKPEKAKEDREHPADSAEADGRTPPERREAPKPRPSTEVAPPRGGSPPPDKPKPGDPAWLAYRNSQTGGR